MLVLSPAEPLRKQVYEEIAELPDAAGFYVRHGYGGVAISADTGNRAAGIIRVGAPQDELQAALPHLERVLG